MVNHHSRPCDLPGPSGPQYQHHQKAESPWPRCRRWRFHQPRSNRRLRRLVRVRTERCVWSQSDDRESYVTEACPALVAQVPGVPIAEKAWSIYQSAAAPEADGDSGPTIVRFFTKAARVPIRTQSICGTAFEDLSAFFQGKGDKGAETKGGKIKIGSGNDYLMLGFDPNVA